MVDIYQFIVASDWSWCTTGDRDESRIGQSVVHGTLLDDAWIVVSLKRNVNNDDADFKSCVEQIVPDLLICRLFVEQIVQDLLICHRPKFSLGFFCTYVSIIFDQFI